MSFLGDENCIRDIDTSDIGTWWERCIYCLWGCKYSRGKSCVCIFERMHILIFLFLFIILLFGTGCSNCCTSCFTVKWTKLCWSGAVLRAITYLSTFCKRDCEDSKIRQSGMLLRCTCFPIYTAIVLVFVLLALLKRIGRGYQKFSPKMVYSNQSRKKLNQKN
jgi:hypothetical protein